MTLPKILPCPDCGKSGHMGIFKYDSGAVYVECDRCGLGTVGCGYRGPCASSQLNAVRWHNAAVRENKSVALSASKEPDHD